MSEFSDSSLERELRRLQPAAPSPRLVNGVRAALRSATPRLGEVHRWASPRVWIAASAAAVLLVIAAYAVRRDASWPGARSDARLASALPHAASSAAGALLPGAAAGPPLRFGTVVVDERDEGPVRLTGDGVARRIRRQLVDHAEWYNHEQGVHYAVTRPREEVVLVSLPTF